MKFHSVKVETMLNRSDHITGNAKFVAKLNTKLVLSTLYRAKSISRTDLAKITNLQPATVGSIVDELIRQGFVSDKKDEIIANSVGRPAKILSFNDKAQLIVAIDLEPDRLRVALLSLNLTTLAYSEYGMDRFGSSDKIIAKIIRSCQAIIDTNPEWRKKIIGIGVSLPGTIDVEQGIACSSTNMPNWHNVHIVKELHDVLGLPVYIGRSMHLAALSEKWRRPEIEDRNVVFLVLRTGVGMALLVHGVLYMGSTFTDGEIGHTTIDINGHECECGKRGCLETYISSGAIRKRGIDKIRSGKGQQLLDAVGGDVNNVTPEVIYELAKNGDPECILVVRDIAKCLGLAASNMIQILNPHELVICGSIDLAEEIILNEINSVLAKQLLEPTARGLKTMLSPFKDRASLLGAGVLVLDDIFDLPTLKFPSHMSIEKKKKVRKKKENVVVPT
jgi:predicted NBD/HSP70 family sugar kinase